MSFERVRFTEDALQDLRDLATQDKALVLQALHVAKRVDAGELRGKDLGYYDKTGDLSDCFRVYFGAKANADTHRIVFRETGDGTEVVEVVTVAERRSDVAYLLAALRLGRLEDPVRIADARRRIAQARRQPRQSP